MPGVRYEASGTSGDVPLEQAFLLANNLTGANTATVPGSIYAGDLCVLTNAAALTGTPAVPVIRPLLSNDLATATPAISVSGILGVFTENITTNASGQIIARPNFGLTLPPGVIFSMPAPSGRFPVETATGRHRVPVILAAAANVFRARVNPAYAPGATHLLDGTKAGLTIVANPTGVNNYYIDPTATGAAQCLVIIKPDETDPNYNVASGGGVVFFQFLAPYDQLRVGGLYTT